MKKLVLFFLLLTTSNAFAAIGIEEACEGTPSTAQADTYECGAFGPDNDRILVAFACVSDTVDAGEMSGGSLTWTKITSVTYGSHTAYAFWADTGNPAPGLVNPTIDVTGDEGTGATIITYSVSGAEISGSDPVKQFKTATTTGTNPTITMDAAFAATSAALAVVCGAYTAPFVTEINGGNWNEQADAGYSTPTNAMGSGYLAGETGSTVTFTNGSSVQHGLIGVELCESGLCGGGGGSSSHVILEDY